MHADEARSELALVALVVVAQIAVPLALFVWGRAVARRHGDAPRWRFVSHVPLVALVLGVAPCAVPVVAYVLAFALMAHADAATRATFLARGIATSMNLAAIGVALSALLSVVSALLLLYGRLRAPAA